jgi:membrane protease YdiL (CAAX protease family)
VVALLGALPALLLLATLAGERMAPPATTPAWIAWLLVQPVAEECVFRGLLQGQLLRLTSRRRAGPVTLANALATGAFVLAHLAVQPVPWALAVAVPSLVFGHLRERFASVVPAIVLHAAYNAGFAGLATALAP